MTAFASNLSARFTQPAGNPVLAAHQLVAELAQIYYEQPNDDTARAIVAVPPGSWSDDPSFVNALLGALAGNPIIQPVTVSKLFDSFPASTACRNACRLLSGTGDAGLPAGAIRTQRQRIDGFAVGRTDGSLAERPVRGTWSWPVSPSPAATGPAVGGAPATPDRPSTPSWPSWRWPAASPSP